MDKKLRKPFSRIGGKTKLVPFLLSILPKHSTYVEAFVGGGSLFFAKPLAERNVINDLDTDIVNMYEDIRDISSIPFSFNETNMSKEVFNTLLATTQFASTEERLFRNLYLTKNSFSGSRKCYGENNRDEPLTYLKRNLLHFQHKLKNTNIHNADYQEIIKEYDSPTTLFYLDPPYSKNKKGWGYEHEVSLESLKDNLSKIKGDFIMSYDYSPDIVDEFKEYTIIEVDTKYETTQKYSTTKEIVVLKHQPNTNPAP